MAKTSGFDFMIAFVKDYLEGKKERMFFDLDFDHYLIQQYPKMERENPELADCFVFYLSEEGIDCSDDLSDAEHKRLIRRQFDEFLAAVRDGIL